MEKLRPSKDRKGAQDLRGCLMQSLPVSETSKQLTCFGCSGLLQNDFT